VSGDRTPSLEPAAPILGRGGRHASSAQRLAILYARLALGAAFLSAVASRFGLWRNGNDFAAFVRWTAEVNSFLPASFAPWLAGAATVAEISCGTALLVGFQTRRAALASAALLALFGTAMAISYGPKEPLDYSVFSASAAALLLAVAAAAERNGEA